MDFRMSFQAYLSKLVSVDRFQSTELQPRFMRDEGNAAAPVQELARQAALEDVTSRYHHFW